MAWERTPRDAAAWRRFVRTLAAPQICVPEHRVRRGYVWQHTLETGFYLNPPSFSGWCNPQI